MEKEIERISFSELKVWNDCPYKHKLRYIDKISGFEGNVYTAFGTAMHSACEEKVQRRQSDIYNIFLDQFTQQLNLLSSKPTTQEEELISKMKEQAKPICENILPGLKGQFENFEVFSVEEQLMENIDIPESYGKKFKGFIDLVLRTSDGYYHIIDWKTCSWGWDSRKKTDKLTTYQLAYYKHFFSRKHGIDLSKIKTYFSLLKRTAKKNHVEIFEVPCGATKIQNSLKLLSSALNNINRGTQIKNRLSCKYCEFYKTENCK